mgnify:CR=1 FL=1
MYYDYIKQMSFKDEVVKDISKMVADKTEPLYKIKYILPKLTRFFPSSGDDSDDDDGDTKYAVNCDIKTVIYNRSTYIENHQDSCLEYTKCCWEELIDKRYTHHKIEKFGHECKFDEHIVACKISVELIN